MTPPNHAELARTKTAKASGGDVNYYLVLIPATDSAPECTVEIEDIIEALDMRFAEANVFKAIVRSTKLRQDLGKPGSSAIYEAEKAVYYADRIVAQTMRVQNGDQNDGIFGLDASLEIPDPKRLPPYRFRIENFIEALNPTDIERDILDAFFSYCLIRRDMTAPASQLKYARKIAAQSRLLLDQA